MGVVSSRKSKFRKGEREQSGEKILGKDNLLINDTDINEISPFFQNAPPTNLKILERPKSLVWKRSDPSLAIINSPFGLIGKDMIWEIFSFLSFRDLYFVSLTCHEFAVNTWKGIKVITEDSWKMTNFHVQFLCQKCVNLEFLQLKLGKNVTNECISNLGNLPKLKTLRVKSKQAKDITNTFCAILGSQKQNLSNLQNIYLEGKISNLGIRNICYHFKKLKSLDIENCNGNFTDSFFREVFWSLEDIQYLNIKGHSSTLSQSLLSSFQTSHPNLIEFKY